jgi:predicted nuclease of predicted toxin-antitoxin system
MKMLFDENLSHKLVRLLEDLLPHSIHVRDVGLKAASDTEVWEYAKNNDLILVSKDADMHQRSFLFGPPPKVVWVRLGNCSTSDVERLLRENVSTINAFSDNADSSFLILSQRLVSKPRKPDATSKDGVPT